MKIKSQLYQSGPDAKKTIQTNELSMTRNVSTTLLSTSEWFVFRRDSVIIALLGGG